MAQRLKDTHYVDGIKNFSAKNVTSDTLTESVKQRLAPGKALEKGTESNVKNAADSYNNIAAIANDPNTSPDLKNFEIAQQVLSNAAAFDPTGIVGIAGAYTKPECNLIGPPGNVPMNAAPPPAPKTAKE